MTRPNPAPSSLLLFGFLRVLLAIVTVAPDVAAEDIRRLPNSKLIQRIDAAVRSEMTQQQAVGVAVGVILKSQLVYTTAFGEADRSLRIPMTTDSVLNWASNSKPLMAVAAFRLVEQGRLKLDADVRDYVPEFPAKRFPVTVRHLLTHQSGIPHYSNGRVIVQPGFRQDNNQMDAVRAIGRFSHSPLIFQPGERYSYSSYAYVLLSAVVQRAAGTSIQDYLSDTIVSPLKLTSFQWDVSTDGQPDWAKGYYQIAGFVRESGESANAWKHGAGGFKSNISDFGRWAEAVMDRRILESATWEDMLRIIPPTGGTSTSMAHGIVVQGRGQEQRLSHSGSQSEATSIMVLFPGTGEGVVVLTNSRHATPSRIADRVFQELRKPEKQ